MAKLKMKFPQRKASLVTEYPDELRQALTKHFKNVYLNVQAYIVEYEMYTVPMQQPNLELLKTLGKTRTAITALNYNRQLMLRLPSLDEQYHCVSRYFAPANGS